MPTYQLRLINYSNPVSEEYIIHLESEKIKKNDKGGNVMRELILRFIESISKSPRSNIQ
jgi:hypothetical protein